MRQKSGPAKAPAEQVMKEIRRATLVDWQEMVLSQTISAHITWHFTLLRSVAILG